MTEKIAVLGSTGSVGKQALDVCRTLGIKVTALAAGRDTKTLEDQIRRFSPALCAVADEKAAEDLKIRVADTDVKIISGKDSAAQVAAMSDSDTVLNSGSGVAGLRPTLASAEVGKNIALANKESLVTFGAGVTDAVKKNGVKLLPVDSEHSAIFQCIAGRQVYGQKVNKILLTASGGPFFGKKRSELEAIKLSDALAHPTWNMGNRITIDSATMMNKGFEVIEAVWLFDVKPEQVEVVVHRESIIHSMVEYIDHTVIAQLASPDMRLCAQYALTYPDRCESSVLPLAYEAIKRGGVVPAAMNGADEEAVSMFLQGKIGFCDIFDLVIKATLDAPTVVSPTIEDIECADRNARETVKKMI